MQFESELSNDPCVPMETVRRMMCDLAAHLQEDQSKIEDPEALALFETSREVLKGIQMAFAHYAARSEKARQR